MPLERLRILETIKRIHLFRAVEDARLEAAANLIEQIDVPAGTVIFAEGADPDYFYIIESGRVRLSRSAGRGQADISLGVLQDDDYFGEEVLETTWPRQVTATAVEDSHLLRISIPKFIDMLNIIPPLANRLQFILDSYKLMVRTSPGFTWRSADEAVLFIARRHILMLFKMVFPPLIAGFILIPFLSYLFMRSPGFITAGMLFLGSLVILVWLAWAYIDWSNDYYIVTSERVVYKERVILIYDSREESPLSAIQSTTINTSVWGRWLNFGNVAIRTFYGTVLFRSVPNPEQVMALIQQQQLRAQFYQRRSDIRSIQEFLNKRLTEGPQRPTPGAQRRGQSKPEPMREFLSTLFHLRWQVGKTIIHRTHWFILLQKVFLPTLLLFGLFTLLMLSVWNQFALLSVQATCGLLFLAGVIVFGWWFYQYMDWHNDIYIISPDQVIDVNKRPLGHEERQAAPIKNILSIEFRRIGIMGLLLNFGTVYIRVGDRQLTFDNVYKPSDVQRELFHRLAEVNAEEKKAQIEAEKQRLGDWFASYAALSRRNQLGQNPTPGTDNPI